MDKKQAIEELITIRDFIRWGYSQLNQSEAFFGHGMDNALDEALTLVLHSLHLPFDLPESWTDTRLTHDERVILADRLERRIVERVPTAYLTNEAWFANLSFYVDERVLIPRSPIAELIESAFHPWVEPGQIKSVLDMCTGSGCIAIACAHVFADARVDAVDVSSEALEVTRMNIEQHGMEDQVFAVESDLFQAIGEKRYNLIVCNPPYVSCSEMKELPGEYLHEPALGLQAGSDGLDIVRTILKEAPRHLMESGVLIVEVGDSQDALIQAFPDVPFLWLDFSRGGEGVFLLTADQLEYVQE